MAMQPFHHKSQLPEIERETFICAHYPACKFSTQDEQSLVRHLDEGHDTDTTEERDDENVESTVISTTDKEAITCNRTMLKVLIKNNAFPPLNGRKHWSVLLKNDKSLGTGKLRPNGKFTFYGAIGGKVKASSARDLHRKVLPRASSNAAYASIYVDGRSIATWKSIWLGSRKTPKGASRNFVQETHENTQDDGIFLAATIPPQKEAIFDMEEEASDLNSPSQPLSRSINKEASSHETAQKSVNSIPTSLLQTFVIPDTKIPSNTTSTSGKMQQNTATFSPPLPPSAPVSSVTTTTTTTTAITRPLEKFDTPTNPPSLDGSTQHTRSSSNKDDREKSSQPVSDRERALHDQMAQQRTYYTQVHYNLVRRLTVAIGALEEVERRGTIKIYSHGEPVEKDLKSSLKSIRTYLMETVATAGCQ